MQAVLPPLLCSVAAAAEAHAARGGGSFGRPASEPHLDHLDGSLRATYALVWAAGAELFVFQSANTSSYEQVM